MRNALNEMESMDVTRLLAKCLWTLICMRCMNDGLCNVEGLWYEGSPNIYEIIDFENPRFDKLIMTLEF